MQIFIELFQLMALRVIILGYMSVMLFVAHPVI